MIFRSAHLSRLPGHVKAIRGLIWIYFFLLIFEGFLRMILPALSDALLVIRDPFLLAAYVIAYLSGMFPWNRYIISFWALGAVAVIVGLAVLPFPLVIAYGFRVAFLHVPLVFLMAAVFDADDVLTFGKWFLILSIPIAFLMVAQFQAGPDSWLNRGLDNQFEQIESAKGKVRPPGTFTFILGPALFYAYVTGFLLYSQFQQRHFPKWLTLASAFATCLAFAVSGSRGMLAYSAMVVLAATVAIALSQAKQLVRILQFALLAGVAFLLASQAPVFNEGSAVLTERIESASGHEGGMVGFLSRAVAPYENSLHAAKRAKLEGEGLGVGTNAGSALMGGGGAFLLAEEEWSRAVLELGPLIGYAWLLFRVGLVLWLFARALRHARTGTMLPLTIFVTFALDFSSGQWGQPTVLGFSVVGAGLCLAAMRPRATEPVGLQQ